MSVKLAAADRQHYNGKPNDRNYRAIATLPVTACRGKLNAYHTCVHISLVPHRRSLNSTTRPPQISPQSVTR
jgi:hypothetical protein